MRFKLFQMLAAALLFSTPSFVFAQRETGGGGGSAHSTFIRMGHTVVWFLENQPRGQALLKKHDLSVDLLRETLRPENIRAVDEPLKDRLGNDVDAVSMPGRIMINNSKWNEHIDKKRNVYHLVFKEMLRSTHIYDKQALEISNEINPLDESEVVGFKGSTEEALIVKGSAGSRNETASPGHAIT